MKRIITFAAFTALIAGYALADERTGTTGDSVAAVKDILIQIEHQWGVLGLITEKSSLRGQDTSRQRRFTDVFVKRDSRWQAVVSHESRAAGE